MGKKMTTFTEFVVRVYHIKEDDDPLNSRNSAKQFQEWLMYHTTDRKITVKKVKKQKCHIKE